jgi:sigma-E factor negative regulatory protein RseC
MSMLEVGYVEETQGDIAKVRMTRTSMCASCKKCGLFAAGGSGDLLIEARNDSNAVPGDWVRVEMDSSNVLKAAFIVYIVPLLFAAVGYPVGLWVSRGLDLLVSPETAGIAGAALFFLGSYGVIRAYDRRCWANREFMPVVKGVLQDRETH